MTGNTGNGCVKCGHTEVEEGTLSQQDLDYLRCLMCKDNNFKTITCKIVAIQNFIKQIIIERVILSIYSLVDN